MSILIVYELLWFSHMINEESCNIATSCASLHKEFNFTFCVGAYHLTVCFHIFPKISLLYLCLHEIWGLGIIVQGRVVTGKLKLFHDRIWYALTPSHFVVLLTDIVLLQSCQSLTDKNKPKRWGEAGHFRCWKKIIDSCYSWSGANPSPVLMLQLVCDASCFFIVFNNDNGHLSLDVGCNLW